MPRKHLSPRKARAELFALKLEKARYEIRALRRAEREAEAALALRKSNSDWVDMDQELKRLHFEMELDEMENCIDERTPKIPILDKSIMAQLRAGSALSAPKQTAPAIPFETLDRRQPQNGKDWKYPGTIEGRHPADDYRNYQD